MKRRFVSTSVALLLALGMLGSPAPTRAAPITVLGARIPFYLDRPEEKRVDSLIYRGGLLLASPASGFGGWSDIAVSADGSEILAISDDAHWLRAHLTYDRGGDLAGIDSADMAPMLDLNGRPMIGKDGDAEGLTLEHANDTKGAVLVSFERNVRVWRYDLKDGFTARPTNVPIGDWVKPLRDNEQLEAITLVKPDTLLAIAEAKVAPGDDILAAFETYPGNGTAHSRMLSVVPHDPFAVTSVATAPDGGIFLLERRFSLAGGVGMEIRHVDSADIREGAHLEGKVLANVGFQNTNIDNMEGIAVRKGRNGETLLYLISDNNYSPLQRTLLLMFELKAQP